MTLKICHDCGKPYNEAKNGPITFFCSNSCADKHSNIKKTLHRQLQKMFKESSRWEFLPFEAVY